MKVQAKHIMIYVYTLIYVDQKGLKQDQDQAADKRPRCFTLDASAS